jgi:hypothetical protein
MNIARVNRDLLLIGHGNFRKATWTFDKHGIPNFIVLYGAFVLDQNKFNLPDLNILIPVAPNLYDPAGDGVFHFYRFVYVDDSLMIRDQQTGQFRRIYRGYNHNLYKRDKIPSRSGWQWICVMHPTCGGNEAILDLLASVQTFLNNDA